ncbi:LysR substrate-binding domain-containing protein [Cobetia sp. LC6]|uniref:LysR substrate-binding domain-containing protein n=1 Tax=Cobetia sp. LC6 TaxID=3050947 RepID=UPI00255486D3|nr:LysR substrate-binding domain-containing protein [Cobetia sp. LC6]MDL2191364.1 LysR substrate-binding domain-containing protein [Cobetia sp. LC6]
MDVSPSFAAKWLMPRLASFRHAHPEWQLRVHASEGLSNLHQDGIDLPIRQGSGQHDAGLKAIWLTGLEHITVCSLGYPEQLGERLDRLDMRGCVLIEDSHQGLHTFAAHFSGLEKADRLWVNRTSLAIDVALADQGIALTPRLMAAEGIAKGQLVTLRGLPDQGQDSIWSTPGRGRIRQSRSCCRGFASSWGCCKKYERTPPWAYAKTPQHHYETTTMLAGEGWA